MIQDRVIPILPEAVSPDWMTEALRSAGLIRHSRVISMRRELVGSQGIIGQVARFNLVYDLAEENQVPSLIGKFPHPDPNMRQGCNQMYQREISFYKELGANPNIVVPKYYFSAIDAERAENILLLEDLSQNSRPGCLVCGCTIEEAQAALVRLARFHAAWWEDKNLEQFPWLSHKREFYAAYPTDQFMNAFEELLERIRRELPEFELSPSFVQAAGLLAKNFPRIKNFLYNAPTTLIHDDYHLDNMIFRGAETAPEPVIIDWQCVAKGPGVSDLGYFISFSLSPEQRQEAENDLLKLYFSTLCENGVTGYDFSRFLLDYRFSALEPLERAVQVRFALDSSNPRALAIYESILPRFRSFIEDCRIEELLS